VSFGPIFKKMKNFPSSKKISINRYIYFVATILALTLGGAAAISTYKIFDATEKLKFVIDHDVRLARAAERWSLLVQQNVARAFVRANVELVGYKASFESDFQKTSKIIGDTQQEVAALITDRNIREAFDTAVEVRKKVVAITDNIAKVKSNGTAEEIHNYIQQQYEPQVRSYLGTLATLARVASDHADLKIAELERSNRKIVAGISVVILIAMLTAALATVMLKNLIAKPLKNAIDNARAISRGDLTVIIGEETTSEFSALSDALIAMQSSIKDIVSEIQRTTNQVNHTSGEIVDGNVNLSSRTEKQAISIEETVSTMAHLTDTVKRNADSVQEVNQLAFQASGIASAGGKAVSEVVSTMNAINESSLRIVDIISVIDGIAFQTNILALNAAVEAARAGEQGRGFAVVASEVRSLAQRSASAAKEIKNLIDDSVATVSCGSKLVEHAGVTMSQVVSSVQRVADILGEVGSAIREQSAGILEIGQAINVIDDGIQKNAALVEHSAASASSLRDQASTLSGLVHRFVCVT